MHSRLILNIFQKGCLFILLCLLPVSLVAQADQIIRIGVYENPPKIYTDERGRVTGFHGEFIREIASALDWNIDFVHGSWDELLDMTESGDIDIMMDVAFSEERLGRFAFNSESVFINWGVVYSRDGFQPQNLFDLEGMRIAGMEGGIHMDGETGIVSLCREFQINIDVLPVPDYTAAFQLVENGEADAAVVNRIFGNTFEGSYDVHRTPIIFNPVAIKYAFPKDSARTPLLIEGIDSCLVRFKNSNDSIYYVLLDEYLAGYVEEKTEIPIWLRWTLTVAVILLLFLVSLMIKLRNEIKRRSLVERELLEAKKEAEAANRAKSRFLANMTHELRTPMNAILGYSELLQRSSDLSDHQRKNLEIINSSGEQLLALINEVLDMSRIEADKVSYHEGVIDPVVLLRQITMFLKPAAAKKGIEIDVRISDTMPGFLRSDEQKIRQILLNLVSNAVKYTPAGYVLIEAGLSPEDDGVCIISVADSGPGITEENQKRIFEPFDRGSMVAASESGAGLGLAISMKYAQFLGGNLWLEKSDVHGSTFAFSFRFNPGEEGDVGGERVDIKVLRLKPGSEPVRILIVDDNGVNRQLLKELLESLGFSVETAANGFEGMEIYRRWNPDCMLIDVLMPGKSGIELVRDIRGDSDGGSVKIIALTASILDEDREGIVEAGVDAFLYKPCPEEDLLKEIGRLLSVEYEYDDVNPSPEKPPGLPKGIPAGLKEPLSRAVRMGSRRDVLELMETAELPPDLKKQIAELADGYLFSRIMDLLNTLPEV